MRVVHCHLKLRTRFKNSNVVYSPWYCTDARRKCLNNKKPTVFEMLLYQWMLQISWMNRETNEEEVARTHARAVCTYTRAK